MKSVKELKNLKNKKVFLRVDFNVVIKDGKAAETFKIEVVKETLDFLLARGAKVSLASHLGRPDGERKEEFSLEQIKDDVAKVLEVEVEFVPDCVGEKVKKAQENQKENQVLLLENLRFHEGEKKNDSEFAKSLAQNFDIFINDAFSVCHRDQASVTGITNFLESFSGIRLGKEIREMEKIKSNFQSPAVAVIGGAKIETKLPVIEFFEEKYDFVLVGGKIANEAIDEKKEFSKKVVLPWDFVDDRLDIGEKTLKKFIDILNSAKTIVWNGPTGKYEEEKYSRSSRAILEEIINSSAYSVLGGGETLEVLKLWGNKEKIGFVSTGGGAMLVYLSGGKMPGLKVLN